MDYRERLLTLARAYCDATKLSMPRVATLVHNQGAFFKRLEEGAGCTVDTYEKCIQWFADRWPSDLAWPAGLTRPTNTVAADARPGDVAAFSGSKPHLAIAETATESAGARNPTDTATETAGDLPPQRLVSDVAIFGR